MNPGRMYQMLPTLVAEISDQVLAIDAAFRSWGWRCHIVAEHVQLDSSEDVRGPRGLLRQLEPDDLLLYHHSIGSDLARLFARAVSRRKILLYHNITPPELLAHAPDLAAKAQHGLAQLREIARCRPLGLAVSEYNCAELVRLGIRRTGVLPLPVTPRRARVFEEAARQRASVHGHDGARFVFVGRVVPHKRIELLIQALALFRRQFDPKACLRIVGAVDAAPSYVERLRVLSAAENTDVCFCGKLDFDAVGRESCAANAFWCASAHEGFCLPLVEAMLARLPVVAVDAGAVAETLGGSGMLIPRADPALMAEATARLLGDPGLLQAVIERQLKRAANFDQGTFVETLRLHLESLLGES